MKKVFLTLLVVIGVGLSSLAWAEEPPLELAAVDKWLGVSVAGAAAAAPDWSDDFESNDFTGWDDGEVSDGENNLSVGTTIKNGSYGLEFEWDNTDITWVQQSEASDYTTSCTTFYIALSDVTTVDTANGQYRPISATDKTGWDGGAQQWSFRFYTEVGSPFNVERMNCTYKTDGGSTLAGYATLTTQPVADTLYQVKVEYKVSSGPGADDGTFKVWFDGTLEHNVSGIDNDEQLGVGAILAGNRLFEWTTAASHSYMDDFELYNGACP